MLNRLRLFFRHSVLALLALSPLATHAQSFIGEPQQVVVPDDLKKVLKEYAVYRLDAATMKQFANTAAESAPMNIQIGTHNWNLHLRPNHVLAPGYFMQVSTENGIEIHKRKENLAFKGYDSNGGGKARLTFDTDFINGYVEEGGERYYIEPLWFHQSDLPRDLFLVYPRSAVIRDQDATCTELTSEEDMEHLQNMAKQKSSQAEFSGCYEIEIAIASDKSMFNKYGSASAVEAHNVAVINDVEGDYTGAFNHDMSFVIVTQFVVSGTDPWTASTDAGTLLGSFRNWGNANGFGIGVNAFDNGELWTNRDFDGSTVGIAYVPGMCNANKYHCLQDWTSNSELLRCMTSHEIGHNMSAGHDPQGGGSCPPNFIMCPFVSTSSSWSSNSINVISAYITARINGGCFQPCGSNQPPTANFDWNPNPACRGQQVTFSDLSTNNTTRSWTFPNGSPATSTAQNPVVVWNTAGTYNVVLTVTGIGGTASTTKAVLVKPTATANFTYTFSGLTYTFVSTSTNANSYLWDFGDGNFSFEQNPVYTYPFAGTYTVTLTVENDCGTSTKSVVLNTIPTAEFSANPTAGCAPLVVQFTNESSSNATTFLWSFPGGSPTASNMKDPIVQYQTSGTFTVTLTAINNTGSNSISKTSYIVVQNVPSSNFTYSIDTLTVTFTNQSTGANTYLWNFGDNTTSTQQHPVHTYAQSGTYTVTLTSTNACGSTTSTKSVTVVALPVAGFTADTTSGCAPLTVQYTSQSLGNPTAYYWYFPGGTPDTSSAQNPTVTYNTPGNYAVTHIVTNVFGNDTLTINNFITITPPPTSGFSSTTNGFNATFTNSSTNATSYNWSFGDGNSSTNANPTHTYAADGTYTVTLTATGPCGTSTMSHTVTIITPPLAGFTASPTSGCGPLTVQFTNTSSSNSTSYAWQFPGGNPASSSVANPTVIYTAPGTYTVTLTVSNSAGSNTATQTNYITVNPGPAAGFSSTTNGFSATFTNSSSNATSYNWAFGDGNTSTNANPTHTYAADGTYTVTLTATGPCGTSTVSQSVTIVTPPSAGFTASPTSGCGPLSVQFTSTSSSNSVNFLWDFPGGSPTSSSAQNPVVVYNAPGTYTVTLTVSNSAGSNSATQTSYITVNPGPTAAFSSAVNGSSATFTNTSSNAGTYSWNFGDNGTSTNANPTHIYAADGTYTVTLTATGPCGTSTTTQSVTIATPPTAGFTATPTADCGPLTVQFTSTSSPNSTGFDWQFPGGTPSSSTAQNPVVVYNAPGTYSVTLTVTNAQGSNSTTQTNLVTVFENASSSFTSTTTGASVSFQNTSTNSTTYHWNFGDNGESTQEDPTHTYATDGTYTVTLTSSNSCGSSTSTQTVTIITPPTAGFTAGPQTGCGPLTVQFTSTASANATNFYWEFPGGTPATSSDENPMVVYTAPGSYSVTFTASNSAGSNTSTQTNIVVVQPDPTAAFDTSISGGTASFDNNSGNATTYAWTFGDNGTSAEENPKHTYTASGTYTVTLTATGPCGSATSTQTVTILLPPQASFSASTLEGCGPLTVAFTNLSSADATNLDWTFEGGTPATSTAANPTVTFDQPGTHNVTLTASNAAGSNSFSVSVTVLPLPTAGFSVQNAGLGVVLTNSSQNATSYAWSFGDGNTSMETSPSHTYQLPGTYTITLRATNDCGTVEISREVTIQGTAPIANFKPDATQGCVPFTVQFSDQSAGNPTAWSWSFIGGNPATSNAQNPSVTYSAPGLYTVELEVTNPYGTNKSTQTNLIEALALPLAAFTHAATDLNVQFTNQSQFGTTYTWNFGDGNMSNDPSPTHVYANPGTYTVSLTVLNNCGATTLQKMITLTSAAGEANWVEMFSLFPNPTTGVFTVNMRGAPESELEFVLSNALGQRVDRQTINFGTGSLSHTFDYAELPAGFYSLQISSGSRTMEVKVAIQR
ncbi:MAG: PKD domain-containing protein [Saprospiraceae bacterium]